MATLMSSADIGRGPWHDADMLALNTSWSDTGELSVSLHCVIHPEEPLDSLSGIGIHSPGVKIQFAKVWQLQANGIGYTSSREVVQDWEVMQQSTLIDQLHGYGMGINAALTHHRINASGGSAIDVICEQVWIENAD